MEKPEASPKTMQFHSAVLGYLGDHAVLRNNLVLQGGGALCFFYGSQRMTSDLDFVCTKLNRRLISELSHGVSTATSTSFELTEGHDYIAVTYKNNDGLAVGTVEAASQTAYECVRGSNVYVLSGTELLTDKITTLYHRLDKRGVIVDTDILAILYLFGLGYRATPKQIQGKARQYGYKAWDRQINNRLRNALEARKNIARETLEMVLGTS